jgi:lysyl-tRNA synthetase class 1
LRAIFGKEPPVNVPYEFFLVGGAKMSSSRGLGASARDVADLLPPEVLRFLMIRTKPNSPVNFDVQEEGIIKLFNEFDRYQARVYRDKNATPDETLVFKLAEIQPQGDFFQANFQLVSALAQMPHLNVVLEMQKRLGRELTPIELQALERRIQSVDVWVRGYAREEEKTRLQETLPARASELSATQCAFLRRLGDALENVAWEDDVLQATVFETARLTPIEQPVAFKAIYRVLLDKEAGPKAGNLFAYLERDFLRKRFAEVPFDREAFWRESALSESDFAKWLQQNREKIVSYSHALQSASGGNVLELTAEMQDGKKHLRRVWLQATPDVPNLLQGLV